MRAARDRTELEPRPARPRWCDGLPDVTAKIACEGREHRITWRRGKLVLEDHDLLAERSLVALGGTPPACLQVLDAWQRRRAIGLLPSSLLSEHDLPPAEVAYRRQRYEAHLEVTCHRTLPAHFRVHFERWNRSERDRERRLWELALIEALPAAMRRALALSMLVAIERSWDDDCAAQRRRTETLLADTANPLLEQSARQWRRNLKPYASFVVETDVVTPRDQPTCAGLLATDGGALLLRLPIAWFFEVWAHGAALVDGCFVLGRAGRAADARSFPVAAVRWERATAHTSRPVQAPALLTKGEDGAWGLRWS